MIQTVYIAVATNYVIYNDTFISIIMADTFSNSHTPVLYDNKPNQRQRDHFEREMSHCRTQSFYVNYIADYKMCQPTRPLLCVAC